MLPPKVNLALPKAPSLSSTQKLFYSKLKTKPLLLSENKDTTWIHLLTRLKQTAKTYNCIRVKWSKQLLQIYFYKTLLGWKTTSHQKHNLLQLLDKLLGLFTAIHQSRSFGILLKSSASNWLLLRIKLSENKWSLDSIQDWERLKRLFKVENPSAKQSLCFAKCEVPFFYSFWKL